MRKLVLAALWVALLSAVAGWLPAQQSETPLIAVTEVQAKPSGATTVEDLVLTHVVPGMKKAGRALRTWRTLTLGRPNTYAFVTPIENFAQLDSPPAWVQALGPERSARFYSQVRPAIDSVRTYVLRNRGDLSYLSGGTFNVSKALIVRMIAQPGKTAEMEQLLKEDVLPAQKKLDKTFVAHQTTIGGNPNEWVFVLEIDNLADFDGGPFMLRAMGPERYAKWQQRIAAVSTAEVSYEVLELVPELSVAAE